MTDNTPTPTPQEIEELHQLGQRLRGLREAAEIPAEEIASELGISPEVYRGYEETGFDVPVSAIYHLARRTGVDLNEILTGGTAKLDTIQVVRAGAGQTAERFPGYHYQDMAWRFTGKIMQPMFVKLDPSEAPADLVTHNGQEFNLVLSGAMTLTFDDKEILLETGDCAYFDPTHPHGQKCASNVPTTFVSVIAE